MLKSSDTCQDLRRTFLHQMRTVAVPVLSIAWL